jgi:hypothetical protein
MALNLISKDDFKKMRDESKKADKVTKIKETILNAISTEIKGEKTRTVVKKKTRETKIIQNRSNIVVVKGQTYYNIKFGSFSFGSQPLNEKDIKGSLESLKNDIIKGALDDEIKKYANSDEFKKQQTRFAKKQK